MPCHHCGDGDPLGAGNIQEREMYLVRYVSSRSHSFSHLAEAFDYARGLLASGEQGIAIRDDQGNHIEGVALADHCRTGSLMQHNLKPDR
jgi:hypothetical protein